MSLELDNMMDSPRRDVSCASFATMCRTSTRPCCFLLDMPILLYCHRLHLPLCSRWVILGNILRLCRRGQQRICLQLPTVLCCSCHDIELKALHSTMQLRAVLTKNARQSESRHTKMVFTRDYRHTIGVPSVEDKLAHGPMDELTLSPAGLPNRRSQQGQCGASSEQDRVSEAAVSLALFRTRYDFQHLKVAGNAKEALQ